MKKMILSVCIVLFGAVFLFADMAVIEGLLKEYRTEGVSDFSAQRGKAMWTKEFTVKGEKRTCADCHTTDLKKMGKRVDTGKKIKPMSKSVNSKRYTDTKFIKKWLKRNCRWTLGRFCTPQEKGDFLMYLITN